MGARWRTVMVVVLALLGGLSVDGSPSSAARAGAAAPPTPVVAYLVPWDRSGGLAAIEAGAGVLTEVTPWAYTLEADGEIGFTGGGEAIVDAETVAFLRARGLAVSPSIANLPEGGGWDDARVRAIIADPVRTQAHIDAIVDLVLSHGYDGIDIDYENLGQQPEDRPDFTRFITGLAGALHAHGRTLSVAVYGKRDDAGDSVGARAQDYAALGAVVDQIRLMLYDYNPVVPGPVAPRWWVNDVLAYAVRQVPAARVVQGAGLYGYGWPGSPAPEQFTWADARRRAAERGVPVQWSEDEQAPWFAYDDGPVRREVWFEDARSTGAKLDLGRSHGAGGVMFWRLGGEDPATWSTTAERLRWVNAAAGILPTTGGTGATRLGQATDGVIDTDAYANLPEPGPQWLSIDLGADRPVHRIAVWHYFADRRTYRDVIVQVSGSPTFADGAVTVFNNDADGSAGQGAGADEPYAESRSGLSVAVGGITARYVRLWSEGSDVNAYNHYVEVQVFTDPASPGR